VNKTINDASTFQVDKKRYVYHHNPIFSTTCTHRLHLLHSIIQIEHKDYIVFLFPMSNKNKIHVVIVVIFQKRIGKTNTAFDELVCQTLIDAS
jgi:hypothetical protein